MQPFARFEHAKPGHGSSAGYERCSRRNTDRTSRPTAEKMSMSRIIGCSRSSSAYPAEQPIKSVLDDLAEKDVHHHNGIKWDNRPGNIEPVEHAWHASITQEQVRALAEDEKRERRRAVNLVDENTCGGCGKPTELLATSPGFDGKRCLECARQEYDGEPTEV